MPLVDTVRHVTRMLLSYDQHYITAYMAHIAISITYVSSISISTALAIT